MVQEYKMPKKSLKNFYFLPIALLAQGKPLGGTLEGIPGAYNPDLADQGTGALTKVFSNTLGVFTIVAGLMFMLNFILGGLGWLTASGKADQVEKAKMKMTNSAIGLIIVVASYSIAFIIGEILGFKILDPAKYIKALW